MSMSKWGNIFQGLVGGVYVMPLGQVEMIRYVPHSQTLSIVPGWEFNENISWADGTWCCDGEKWSVDSRDRFISFNRVIMACLEKQVDRDWGKGFGWRMSFFFLRIQVLGRSTRVGSEEASEVGLKTDRFGLQRPPWSASRGHTGRVRAQRRRKILGFCPFPPFMSFLRFARPCLRLVTRNLSFRNICR